MYSMLAAVEQRAEGGGDAGPAASGGGPALLGATHESGGEQEPDTGESPAEVGASRSTRHGRGGHRPARGAGGGRSLDVGRGAQRSGAAVGLARPMGASATRGGRRHGRGRRDRERPVGARWNPAGDTRRRGYTSPGPTPRPGGGAPPAPGPPR